MSGSIKPLQGTVYSRGKTDIDRLIAEHNTAETQAAHDEKIKLIASSHEISEGTARKLYNTAQFLHTGAAIAGSVYGLKALNVGRMPKAPAAATNSTARAVTASSSSRAGPVAANPPGVSSRSVVTTEASQAANTVSRVPGNSAHSALNGLNLNKALASEAQLANLSKNGGTPLAGAGAKRILRDAPKLAEKYGDDPKDWSKITSESYKAADGTVFEIHAYRNVTTGLLVEPKIIPLDLRK